jgi:hypothetical protein
MFNFWYYFDKWISILENPKIRPKFLIWLADYVFAAIIVYVYCWTFVYILDQTRIPKVVLALCVKHVTVDPTTIYCITLYTTGVLTGTIFFDWPKSLSGRSIWAQYKFYKPQVLHFVKACIVGIVIPFYLYCGIKSLFPCITRVSDLWCFRKQI